MFSQLKAICSFSKLKGAHAFPHSYIYIALHVVCLVVVLIPGP